MANGRRTHMPDTAGIDVGVASDGIVPSLDPVVTLLARELAAGRDLPHALACAERLHPELLRCFDTSSPQRFGLHERHLFPDLAPTASVQMWNRATRDHVAFDVDADDWGALHDFIAGSCGGADAASSELDELGAQLIDAGIVTDAEPAPRVQTARPGIYRLQHACALFRSRTTGVLLDPHLHGNFRDAAIGSDFSLAQLAHAVDAIAISHSHNDHWSLSTLLMFPRDIPILVPAVPRGSILCPDFADVLARFGFTRVIVRNWYDPPVEIGDLRVHVVPFHGEQPLRDEQPRDPALYSWGNTYVIETADYKAWCLVDTGTDDRGTMARVAERVADRIGPIDVVLGNITVFKPWSPLYILPGAHYWLALTADQVARFSAMRDHDLTLGPGGVAAICKLAGATTYLPYANWWGPIGGRGAVRPNAPADTELQHLGALQHDLDAIGARTRIVPWCIGDGFTQRGPGGLDRHALELA
jgi:L-ascorbate metabolism protein UlaG (beta-lactamase superfamily)